MYSSEDAINRVVKIGCFPYVREETISFAIGFGISLFCGFSDWSACGTFLDHGRNFLAFLNSIRMIQNEYIYLL